MKTYFALTVLWAGLIAYDGYWAVHYFTHDSAWLGALETVLAVFAAFMLRHTVRRYRAARLRQYRVVRVTVPSEWRK